MNETENKIIEIISNYIKDASLKGILNNNSKLTDEFENLKTSREDIAQFINADNAGTIAEIEISNTSKNDFYKALYNAGYSEYANLRKAFDENPIIKKHEDIADSYISQLNNLELGGNIKYEALVCDLISAINYNKNNFLNSIYTTNNSNSGAFIELQSVKS
jgi:hypothetical protein